jgi:hypothetical protein
MTRTRSRFALALLLAGTFGLAQPVAIPQQLTFTPYHANGISDVGEIDGILSSVPAHPPRLTEASSILAPCLKSSALIPLAAQGAVSSL